MSRPPTGRSAAEAMQQAQESMRRKDLEAALRHFERASRQAPDDPAPLFGVGRVNNMLFRAGAARRALTAALRLRPGDPRLLCEIANTDALSGRFEDALARVDEAIQSDPAYALALCGRIEFLRRLNREGDALEECRSAVARGVRHEGVVGSFAELAAARGQASEAEPYLEAALADPATPLAIKAMLLNRYALGLDKAGAVDEAFKAACRMNSVRAMQWDAAESDRWFEARRHAFTPAVMASLSRSGVRSDLPTFIVGLPRSGTSLLEQMLDCHPLITGIGEHGELAQTILKLYATYGSGQTGGPSWDDVPGHALEARARSHLRVLESLSDGATRVINKMPANALYIPEIVSLFPNARIIRCVRDLPDVGLSCFMTDFTTEHGFTTDLVALGRYMAGHERLVDHFCRLLPTQTFAVRYEHLVDDTEAVLRETLEFLGLPWDNACTRHHESARPVRTASEEQASRPVYTSSVGRWHRYATHLAPLLAELERAGMTLR